MHDFTTSTLRTKQKRSYRKRRRRACCCRERWTEAPAGIRMDKGDVGGLPNTQQKCLLCHGDCKISSASDAKIHLHHICYYFLSPLNALPPTLLPYNLHLLHGCLRQTERDGGAGETEMYLETGSFFFPCGPEGKTRC